MSSPELWPALSATPACAEGSDRASRMAHFGLSENQDPAGSAHGLHRWQLRSSKSRVSKRGRGASDDIPDFAVQRSHHHRKGNRHVLQDC